MHIGRYDMAYVLLNKTVEEKLYSLKRKKNCIAYIYGIMIVIIIKFILISI